MPRSSKKPKWKRFEELVAKVQRSLAPGAIVTLDDRILGKTSGTMRQVDISIKQRVAQFDILVAIDCKDYAKPVDLKSVEEFIGLVQDIGAQKAAMVSANGFTSSAKTKAGNAQVGLYRVVDAEKHDWRSEVAIPVIWEFTYLQKFLLRALTPAGLVVPMRSLLNTALFKKDSQPLGKVTEIVRTLWNQGKLPLKPSTYRGVSLLEGDVHIKTGDSFLEIKLLADLHVTSSMRFGYEPLAEISGFQDQLSGDLITHEFTTADIDVRDVDKNWEVIKTLSDLAVKPMVKHFAFKHIGEDIYTSTGMEVFFH